MARALSPAPAGRRGPADPALEQDRPRPWSDKLSANLLDALQEWNDYGGELFGPHSDQSTWQAGSNAFRSRGAELAAWTQRELGTEYEVLFMTSTGSNGCILPGPTTTPVDGNEHPIEPRRPQGVRSIKVFDQPAPTVTAERKEATSAPGRRPEEATARTSQPLGEVGGAAGTDRSGPIADLSRPRSSVEPAVSIWGRDR
jgi:hypothetical protein